VDPHERIVLETTPDGMSMRAFDLIAPIGKGQRCMIVSPPKAGKTTFLMDVANAVEKNNPEIAVYVLLVDERPEEVTHFRRGVHATVFAASSDLSAQEHVDKAEEAMVAVVERVVAGEDVLLLLDSITRLARGYNNVLEGSGRTLTGGLDASTMHRPRQIFGAARKIEGGGSLTILGTALIDTGSRMDEVIFQEFKGTGNTELVLSRELFERRIFPCIDINKSGSRKEEKLVRPDLLPRLHMLRRVLAGKKAEEAMSGLLGLLQRFPTNEELLESL
jgi:transcription termination factor Rho